MKGVRVSTLRSGKQIWRRRRKIMNGKNLLRTIGGFVLDASLLFGVAIMSSTAVQAQHGGGGHGGGGMGGGGGHGGGGMGGGGFHGGGGLHGGGGGHFCGGFHGGGGGGGGVQCGRGRGCGHVSVFFVAGVGVGGAL